MTALVPMTTLAYYHGPFNSPTLYFSTPSIIRQLPVRFWSYRTCTNPLLVCRASFNYTFSSKRLVIWSPFGCTGQG